MRFILLFSFLVLLRVPEVVQAETNVLLPASGTNLTYPIIITRLPVGMPPEQQGPLADGMLRASYGDKAHLLVVFPDSSTRIISQDFFSACDLEVSFDATHILFAGKKTSADNWNIYEMETDGSNVRQVTNRRTDCRSPIYMATFYTIVSPKPWYQLTFVGSEEGQINEYGSAATTNLYSCKLDGSSVRQLTFNLSSDMDPFIMPNGRLVYSAWQRSRLNRGLKGRISLFGINTDGADNSAFSTDEGRRIKLMPCVTTNRFAVFVEADSVPWDGAGSLSSVSLRRPLHSYHPITKTSDGLFHSPSPLSDGSVLVSKRSFDGTDTHGVYILEPSSGRYKLIFDSPDFHDIQAKAICPRPEPDGRSSVVTEKDPHGKLYCLNVYTTDLEDTGWMPQNSIKRLRVLEGIPITGNIEEQSYGTSTSQAQRRILGEIDLAQDGSFNIEIPGNIPIELQTLDSNGMALQSCSWIWAKNHEPRGCIGCHEDSELTPENVFVDALKRPSVKLTLLQEQRRTVGFRRDIQPIISKRCASCHGNGNTHLNLADDASKTCYEILLNENEQPGHGKYIHPGKSRISPLIWHIFGKNTSREWDNAYSQKDISKMPPSGSMQLTDDEKRTFVEWIDTGAMYGSVPK